MADLNTAEGQREIEDTIRRHERQCRFCRARGYDDCPSIWFAFLRLILYQARTGRI